MPLRRRGHGRVRGYNLRHPNPSSSHASGAGPSFSLWEKGLN
jgi:hypothetical protein